MPSSHGPRSKTRRKLSNSLRNRGMSPPQRIVQQFEDGQKVHLKIDPSVPDGRFHPRFNGHTGEIVGKQGSAWKVRITDGGKVKDLVSVSAHLKAQKN
jgi:large subunit ribosomal protein L21e